MTTQKSRHLLIIDDEEKLLFGLKAVMQSEGYRVTTGKNGEEGLRLAREVNPDLIICDVMMPPPNGFKLKKLLSEDPATAEIPFIFLTARTLDTDRISGLNNGADDYITKPFKVDELLARVEAVLRRVEIGRKRGMRDAEAAMDKLRKNIAANIGHEMRTPLGIILSSLDLAIREKFSCSASEMEWYLDNALVSAQHLQVLINDLVFLNAMDQNGLSKMRQTVNIRFDFLDPINTTVKRWDSKNLDLLISIDPDTHICAPLTEFSHAICHLVDNACKFSPQHGKINIHLAKNGDGGCILTVSDHGPGIPSELHEKVFERYFQASQGASRIYGGLGLGLTIARAVAERLGGSVQILNSPIGCSVQMIIPPGEDEWEKGKPPTPTVK